jgi:hypothetical protein
MTRRMTNNPTFQVNDRVRVTSGGDFNGKVSRVVGHTKTGRIRIIVENTNPYLEGRAFKPENLTKVTEPTNASEEAAMIDELDEQYEWSQSFIGNDAYVLADHVVALYDTKILCNLVATTAEFFHQSVFAHPSLCRHPKPINKICVNESDTDLGSAYVMRSPVPNPVPEGHQETNDPQVVSPSSSEDQVDISSQPVVRTQGDANSSAFTLTSFEMSNMNGCNESMLGNDGDQGILNRVIVTPRRKSKTVKDFRNTPSFALALEVIGATMRENDVPMDDTTTNQLFDLITASSPNQGEY